MRILVLFLLAVGGDAYCVCKKDNPVLNCRGLIPPIPFCPTAQRLSITAPSSKEQFCKKFEWAKALGLTSLTPSPTNMLTLRFEERFELIHLHPRICRSCESLGSCLPIELHSRIFGCTPVKECKERFSTTQAFQMQSKFIRFVDIAAGTLTRPRR